MGIDYTKYLRNILHNTYIYNTFGVAASDTELDPHLLPLFAFHQFVDEAKEKLIIHNPDLVSELELVDYTDKAIRDLAVGKAEADLINGTFDVPSKTIKKRMQFKKRFIQEAIAAHAGVVGKNMPRCTTYQREQRRQKLKDMDDWTKKTVITNGELSFSLAESGVTRQNKKNELYVIAKGVEKIGEASGKKWASVVCTLPAHMHPNPSHGHSSWDGTLPNEGCALLQERWSKLRAVLAKEQITLSGLWTREAHRDGTPHINFLIYFDPAAKHQVKDAFKSYFKHSEKAIKWRDGGDVAKGQKAASFASYALKYFTKFLGDEEIISEETLSEEAWAAAWGIRRYGFFGIPSLSQWRRLRAQRTTPKTSSPILLSLWRAARSNDAKKWISLSGGLGLRNKNRPFQTVSQLSDTGKSFIAVGVQELKTGEIIISKRVGEWSLKSLNYKELKTFNESRQQVTLALSCPRGGTASAKPPAYFANLQQNYPKTQLH